MPNKKTSSKKANAPKNNKKSADQIAAEIKKVTDELVGLAKEAKKRYDKVDGKTKKQVITGVTSAAAIIAAVIGINKMRKK